MSTTNEQNLRIYPPHCKPGSRTLHNSVLPFLQTQTQVRKRMFWGCDFLKFVFSWPAKFYIIPVCILSVTCNITRFFELNVVKKVMKSPGIKYVCSSIPSHLIILERFTRKLDNDNRKCWTRITDSLPPQTDISEVSKNYLHGLSIHDLSLFSDSILTMWNTILFGSICCGLVRDLNLQLTQKKPFVRFLALLNVGNV